MKRELISQALNMLDDRHIGDTASFDPGSIQAPPERIVQMNKKRMISLVLAAALILALGVAAYAAWSIHAARQQELKEDLLIVENEADSYVEYTLPDDGGNGLVLLSAVNDGQEQRLYLNISPVSEEEAASFPDQARFAWSVEGTEIGGTAAPQLPAALSVPGTEEIRTAVMEHAYDKETQTMTLQCLIDADRLREAMKALGTDAVPLCVHMIVGEEEPRDFGPVSFAPTAEQRRDFDFGRAVYHDEELNRDIEIVSLELTPFSAVWKVSYEGAESFHTPDADWDAYQPWSKLEDKVCIDTKLVFSDGSTFSTGGALTCPYENGTVNLFCSWGSAVNINDVQRIVLGDLVLWEVK